MNRHAQSIGGTLVAEFVDVPADLGRHARAGGASSFHPIQRSWQTLGRTPWATRALLLVGVAATIAQPNQALNGAVANAAMADLCVLLILGVAATFVLVAGGIDLCVGAIFFASWVAGSQALNGSHFGPVTSIGLALGTCLVIGGAGGLLNGVAIAYLRINALVATLATAVAISTVAHLVGGGDRGLSNDHEALGGDWLMPHAVVAGLVAAAVTLAGAIVLAHTRFGVRTAAIGSHRRSAERMGVPVRGHMLRIYLLSGTLSGLAGSVSLIGSSTETTATSYLQTLVVLLGAIAGGTSVAGGVGTVSGTAVCLVLVAVIGHATGVGDGVTALQGCAIAAGLLLVVYAASKRCAAGWARS